MWVLWQAINGCSSRSGGPGPAWPMGRSAQARWQTIAPGEGWPGGARGARRFQHTRGLWLLSEPLPEVPVDEAVEDVPGVLGRAGGSCVQCQRGAGWGSLAVVDCAPTVTATSAAARDQLRQNVAEKFICDSSHPELVLPEERQRRQRRSAEIAEVAALPSWETSFTPSDARNVKL